jgi:hypothetical protein
MRPWMFSLWLGKKLSETSIPSWIITRWKQRKIYETDGHHAAHPPAITFLQGGLRYGDVFHPRERTVAGGPVVHSYRKKNMFPSLPRCAAQARYHVLPSGRSSIWRRFHPRERTVAGGPVVHSYRKKNSFSIATRSAGALSRTVHLIIPTPSHSADRTQPAPGFYLFFQTHVSNKCPTFNYPWVSAHVLPCIWTWPLTWDFETTRGDSLRIEYT